MGSDRGSDIVSSFGPVAVVPLPPFEWNGVESLNIGQTEYVPLAPAMVVSGARVYANPGDANNFILKLIGKDIAQGAFNAQVWKFVTDDGSTHNAILEFDVVDSDGSHVYTVNVAMPENEFVNVVSFHLSPPDDAFVINCVDVIQG